MPPHNKKFRSLWAFIYSMYDFQPTLKLKEIIMYNFFISLSDIIAIFYMEICTMFTAGSTVVLCLPGPMRALRAFVPFIMKAAGSNVFPQIDFISAGKTLVASRCDAESLCEALKDSDACLENVSVFKNYHQFPSSYRDLRTLLEKFDVLIMDDVLSTPEDMITLSEAAKEANCTVLVLAYSADVRKALHGSDPTVMPYHLLVGDKVDNQLHICASCNPNAKQIIFDLSEDGKEIIDVHY